MNDDNEKREKKGGFWSALSGLFRGGPSAVGGASGLGSAGGFGSAAGAGGLFASKAGLVGMVLGVATIAAGVGVIYNFIGPSSKPAYSPELFQNSYYEEESSRAGSERARGRDASAADASTLDMFKEQAKKDGLGGLEGEAADGAAPGAAAEAPAGGPSADSAAPGVPGAGMAAAGVPRLQAAAGFGSGGGGGSGTSIPRMQGGGGLSGGIGGQFQSVYRPPAQANGGKTSGMTASAARVRSSAKYAVPNFNKKGAFGQAKFAKAMGTQARFSTDVGSKGQAGIPFDSSQQTGTGEVGTPATGSGLGGAGVSNGPALKGNDPSLNSNESTPPKVPDPTKENPWQKYEDMAMSSMMWALGMIVLTRILSRLAQDPAMVYLYYAAMATAAAAIFYAGKVIFAGMKMISQFGQKMMGGIYVLTGVMLMIKAIESLGAAAEGAGMDWGKELNGMFKDFKLFG